MTTQLATTSVDNVPDIYSMSGNQQFVSFMIDNDTYGVNIINVREVTPITEITPIFNAEKKVKGYVNIRGQIYLVLDLRLMIGLPSKEIDENSKIIIFKDQIGERFGVLVDEIGDVVDVNSSQIETESHDENNKKSLEEDSGLMEGVCKLDDCLLILLNSNKFLQD